MLVVWCGVVEEGKGKERERERERHTEGAVQGYGLSLLMPIEGLYWGSPKKTTAVTGHAIVNITSFSRGLLFHPQMARKQKKKG